MKLHDIAEWCVLFALAYYTVPFMSGKKMQSLLRLAALNGLISCWYILLNMCGILHDQVVTGLHYRLLLGPWSAVMTPDTARWLSSAYLVTGSVFMPVDRLSVPQGNRVLTFTFSNYATPQPVVLTVVRNREPGQLSDLSDTPLASTPPPLAPPPPPSPPSCPLQSKRGCGCIGKHADSPETLWHQDMLLVHVKAGSAC